MLSLLFTDDILVPSKEKNEKSCVKHNSWLRHYFQMNVIFRSDDVIMYIQNEVTA